MHESGQALIPRGHGVDESPTVGAVAERAPSTGARLITRAVGRCSRSRADH